MKRVSIRRKEVPNYWPVRGYSYPGTFEIPFGDNVTEPRQGFIQIIEEEL